MPRWWVPGNPVDLVAGLNYEGILPIIETLLESGEIDALILLFLIQQQDMDHSSAFDNENRSRVTRRRELMFQMMDVLPNFLFDHMHRFGVPIYSVVNSRRRSPEEKEQTPDEKRVTLYRTIEQACRAIQAMADRNAFQQNL